MVAQKPAFMRKREAACNAILNATSEIIAEKGVDAFTISEIAIRAKINRALIYHYFDNRDNLVAQTIDHILRQYDLFEPGIEPGPQVERRMRMHIEHPELARFFFQMVLTDRPLPRLGPRLEEATGRLEEAGLGRSEAFDTTFAPLIAMLVGASWSIARGELTRLLKMDKKEADRRFIAQIRAFMEHTVPQPAQSVAANSRR